MVAYLIEAYVADQNIADLHARAHSAAAALRSEGHVIRHLHSVLIPADETCFHFVEADSVEAVAELARRAEFGFERILETVEGGLQ